MTAWSRERPTVSGYYWLRDGTAVLLVQIDIGTFDAFYHETVRWHGSNKETRLSSIDGEWQGPLEPKE